MNCSRSCAARIPSNLTWLLHSSQVLAEATGTKPATDDVLRTAARDALLRGRWSRRKAVLVRVCVSVVVLWYVSVCLCASVCVSVGRQASGSLEWHHGAPVSPIFGAPLRWSLLLLKLVAPCIPSLSLEASKACDLRRGAQSGQLLAELRRGFRFHRFRFPFFEFPNSGFRDCFCVSRQPDCSSRGFVQGCSFLKLRR